jgi:DNA repair exonuclease SbcCD ATPase subunit
MKKTIITVIVAATATFLVFNFFGSGKRFNTKAYENKIDSLASEIKGIEKQNDSLESTITVVENQNLILSNNANFLTAKIQNLKADNSKLEAAKAYHPHQVDSFFVDRYKEQYKTPTKDTIQLPIPVAKAAVVDLIDFDRTKTIVLNQDSLITNLQTTVGNKDKIIVTLRTKEDNYQSIISKQVQQQENYKIIVDGLKTDLKKQDFKMKMNKVEKFVMGAAIIGLAVTHK